MDQRPKTTDNVATATAPKSTNPFTFKDEHKSYWGSKWTMDTPIARAWTRCYERGFRLGSPTEDVQTGDNNVQSQLFNFCQATFDPDNDKNPNAMVIFRDGRGAITEESGL